MKNNPDNQAHAKLLLEMLNLKQTKKEVFVGQSFDFVGARIFGGQVLAQGLMASGLTCDLPCHSLHAYFLVGGDIRLPVYYEVKRLRDGKSLSARSVTAVQYPNAKREEIFVMTASHGAMDETHYQDSLVYQDPMPTVPAPDTLQSEQALKQQYLPDIPSMLHERYLRVRPVLVKPLRSRHPINPDKSDPAQAFWLTIPALPNSEALLHQALLAFVSDYFLIGTSLLPHGLSYGSPNLQMASIDHSLHFHRPVDLSDWLLYDLHSTVTGYDRGLNFGRFYQDGKLVASTSQEGLIRQRSAL